MADHSNYHKRSGPLAPIDPYMMRGISTNDIITPIPYNSTALSPDHISTSSSHNLLAHIALALLRIPKYLIGLAIAVIGLFIVILEYLSEKR